MMPDSQLVHQVYVDVYPELFAKLQAAGWTGQIRQQHDQPKWAREASLFILNMTALDFILQFEGLSVEAPSHIGKPGEYTNRIRFYPDHAFAHMKQSAEDYYLDVEDILEDPDAFPVAESNGKVLFMTQSGRAAFIDQTLCGYARAPNPFVLLNTFLFGVDGGGLIEYKRGYFGQRITGRPWW
ncbi:MAG: hypothetical protein F6K00_21620 [Leptolyngbya sp. SIOISBB]|nr:hypothetical protein [Leptolyngbya sp. SIOISBB]